MQHEPPPMRDPQVILEEYCKAVHIPL
jgi:hypothetical protein